MSDDSQVFTLASPFTHTLGPEKGGGTGGVHTELNAFLKEALGTKTKKPAELAAAFRELTAQEQQDMLSNFYAKTFKLKMPTFSLTNPGVLP